MKFGKVQFKLFGEIIDAEQISRPKAKKMFESGKRVFIHPCNMNVSNMWQSPFEIDRSVDFEKYCNSFSYYNCDNERGLYPVFFVQS